MLVLGTILLRRRWQLIRLILLGGVLAGLWAWSRPRQYVASASFAPATSEPSRAGLASLAGQFGLTLPAGSQTVSPEFYASLLQSRTLLVPIARDTFVVQGKGEERVPLLHLLEIPPDRAAPGAELDRGVERLRQMITVSTNKVTGVVTVAVSTRWRRVSLAIARDLVNGVNEYNQRTRQGQAAAERKFIEGRLALAGQELHAAEERLRRFLEGNRAIGNAPELAIERDRIQRDLTLRQQVFTTLTQAYEDARVREVRDTPLITVVEEPSVPAEPKPRGLARFVLFGAVAGGIIAAVLALTSEMMQRRRSEEAAESEEFAGALEDFKHDVLRPVRWMGARIRG